MRQSVRLVSRWPWGSHTQQLHEKLLYSTEWLHYSTDPHLETQLRGKHCCVCVCVWKRYRKRWRVFLPLTVTDRRGVAHVCAWTCVSSLDVISGPTLTSCPSTVSRDTWLHIWLWHTVQCSLLKEQWGIFSPVFSGGVLFCNNTNHISANEQTGKIMRVIRVEYDWGKWNHWSTRYVCRVFLIIRKWKHVGGTWFYTVVVNCIASHLKLNTNLQLIEWKGRILRRLNDWRSQACFTREKSVSLKDWVRTFWFKNYEVKKEKKKWTKINNMRLQNRPGELIFHADFN